MITLTKFSNRKLYQPRHGYLTLKDVVTLIGQGNTIKVLDHNDVDVTDSVIKAAFKELTLDNQILQSLLKEGIRLQN